MHSMSLACSESSVSVGHYAMLSVWVANGCPELSRAQLSPDGALLSERARLCSRTGAGDPDPSSFSVSDDRVDLASPCPSLGFSVLTCAV